MGSSASELEIESMSLNEEQINNQILFCLKHKRLQFGHQSNVYLKFEYLVKHYSQFEIEELYLDHNMIRNEFVQLLTLIDLKQAKEKLKVICLSFNELICQSLKPLGNFDLIHLTTLYLDHNMIGNDGCYYLTKPKLQSLQTLDLTSNCISQEVECSLGLMDDNILRMYIDEVFGYYDSDHSGMLDKKQLVSFFNRLFQAFNDPRRVDQNTINQMLFNFDMNRDGQISKPEMFTLFKRVLMGDSTVYSNATQQKNYGGYNQGDSQGFNQYGNQFSNQSGLNPNISPYNNQFNYSNSPNFSSNKGQEYKNPYQYQGPKYN